MSLHPMRRPGFSTPTWPRSRGRVWPDVLHVTLVEQRAAARWGGEALVNPLGAVFTPRQGGVDRALPALEGPPGTAPQVLVFYRQVNEMLAPLGLKAARLGMDMRRAWRLELGNGVTVTLGREQGMQRLRRFTRYYPEVVAKRAAEIAEVDLRYTNGFAVRWRAPGSTGLSSSGAWPTQETGDNV